LTENLKIPNDVATSHLNETLKPAAAEFFRITAILNFREFYCKVNLLNWPGIYWTQPFGNQ